MRVEVLGKGIQWLVLIIKLRLYLVLRERVLIVPSITLLCFLALVKLLFFQFVVFAFLMLRLYLDLRE